MSAPLLGQVAVDVSAQGLDRLFTYSVPPELASSLTPGQWVKVPFGPRKLAGLYLGPAPSAPEGVQVKPILGVLRELPPLPPKLVELALWLTDRYLCTLVHALRLLVPTEARKEQVRTQYVTHVGLAVTPAEALAAAEAAARRSPWQANVLRHLAALPAAQTSLPELLAALGDGARPAVKTLQQKGLLRSEEVARRRDPFAGSSARTAAIPELMPEQEQVLVAIESERANPFGRQPVLLHGVTGSGKTEVYLRAIAQTLAEGRQSIVLVPEIALTPQLVGRFRGRFGGEVAVLHSALSVGERYDEWQRIRRAEVRIVVGARSAIFAPFDNVGLIILDEEHEHTYKQESPAPLYHAREVAMKRAELEDALLVLGSATPALESYRAAERGAMRLAAMPHRVDDRPMPPVRLVDMRYELRAGNRSIFSAALRDALQETIAAGQQAILFLNRRGYHTFVLCRACGEAIECPNCAVAMTYHLGDRHLACHYCDHKEPVPTICPKCKSKQIKYLGAGTERVEAELKELLPNVKALRMDVDTTRTKGAHAAILGAFERGEAQVLVGTQMIAKGLDFPNVTLVGVILADTILNLPDFRAAERTFQLVTQVAGRAGRGDLAGRVLVQTYDPEHFALQSAATHDYIGFYRQDIKSREMLNYPPYGSLIRLVVAGPVEVDVVQAASRLGRIMQEVPGDLLGPAPAPLARVKGQYRHHLMLKGPDRDAMTAAVRAAFARDGGAWRSSKEVKLTIDVEPLSVL